MATVLQSIIEGVREDLDVRRRQLGEDDVAALARQAPPAVDPMPHFRAPRLSVIAEVKRKSPSKGDLAQISDPAALAAEYAAGGAAAISVLTEERRFGGSLADLRAVRRVVAAPILRKDFMVEPYQVFEARANGADLILLIVAALSDDQLAELGGIATDLGMRILTEVHDEAETERAVASGAEIIGVNARNLKTLEVDRGTFQRLRPLIPKDAVAVAESGIRDSLEAGHYASLGAGVVLVGETLVKGNNPRAAVAEMIRYGSPSSH